MKKERFKLYVDENGKNLEFIYALYDSFLRTTLVENKVIDFTKPVSKISGVYEFSHVNGMSFESLFAQPNNSYLEQHLEYFWSLGGAFQTKYSSVVPTSSEMFPKEGLWNMGAGASYKDKDLKELEGLFQKFRCSKNLVTLKFEMETEIMEKPLQPYPSIWNGILHICNPDLHCRSYASTDKDRFIDLSEKYGISKPNGFKNIADKELFIYRLYAFIRKEDDLIDTYAFK